jgi:hypothetical protein
VNLKWGEIKIIKGHWLIVCNQFIQSFILEGQFYLYFNQRKSQSHGGGLGLKILFMAATWVT